MYGRVPVYVYGLWMAQGYKPVKWRAAALKLCAATALSVQNKSATMRRFSGMKGARHSSGLNGAQCRFAMLVQRRYWQQKSARCGAFLAAFSAVL